MTKLVDNFVWLLVTNKAKEIFSSGLFELYALNEDGSESLIEDMNQIVEAQERGLDIGIEVGSVDDITTKKERVKFSYKGKSYDIEFKIDNSEVWFSLDGFDIHYSENYNKIFVYLSYEIDEAFPPYKLIYLRPIK